ncbi:hypothetical protein HAV15_011214 [Penicillium sp. str. |nr:hypothetical protein HAV15_011214 [Penicillium sp. str. \
MESGIVLFVVGKDRKRFLIHKDEILRPPIVEDIDEVVFGRCCEFVYTGDYSAPSPIYDGIGIQSLTESKSSLLFVPTYTKDWSGESHLPSQRRIEHRP